MSHKQDNKEVMHTVEMQIPAADAAELADAMTTVGDFLHNYSDTLRGEDTDTEEEKKEAKEEKPAAPAEEPRKAIRIELPRDDNGKLSEAFRNAAHFLYAASAFVGGDDKSARKELREIENAPAAGTLKPKNRQEEMAEEGKEPVNLLNWEGGGGTLAHGEVYAIVGKPKSGAFTLAKIFAAIVGDAQFGGFKGSGGCVTLLLADRDSFEAAATIANVTDWAEEWGDGSLSVEARSLRLVSNKRDYAKGEIEKEEANLVVIDGAEELCDITSRKDCWDFLRSLREVASRTDTAVLVTIPEYGEYSNPLQEAAQRVCAEVFQIREDRESVFHVSIPAEGAPLEVFSFTWEGKRDTPTIKEISAAGDLPF